MSYLAAEEELNVAMESIKPVKEVFIGIGNRGVVLLVQVLESFSVKYLNVKSATSNRWAKFV